MDTKLKNNKRISFLLAFLLVTVAVVIFCSQYPVFEKNVQKHKVNVLQSEEFLTEVYRGNLVLYRELAEKAAGELVQYKDLFLQVEEKEADIVYDGSYYSVGALWSETAGEILNDLLKQWEDMVLDREHGIVWEADYCMVDRVTGTRISNTGNAIDKLGTTEADEELKAYYPYYIKMSFNDTGYLEQVSVKGENPDELLRAVQNLMGRSKFLSNSFWSRSPFGGEGEDIYFYYDNTEMKASTTIYNAPRNCTVCYAFSRQQINNLNAANDRDWYNYYAYSGVSGSLLELFLLLAATAFLLPLWKRYTLHKGKAVQIPVELTAVVMLLELGIGVDWIRSLVSGMNGGSLAGMISGNIGFVREYLSDRTAWVIAETINVVVLYLAFGGWYYLVTALGGVWELGIAGFIRERSLIYRYAGKIWRFLKRTVQRFADELLHVDLGEKANKTVFRLVAVNFIILGLICAMWLFGWLALILYSVVLYIVLKKYVQRIQEQYRRLLEATESIAGGNLHTEFDKDWGIFESYKEELAEIQSGFSKAVEEEVKSQKMKTELITNVSHDLKTPLTAITTYIELLKEENLTEGQREEYLAVLENKALRLKTLIEDLFEVSKAGSGNVTLNLQDVDIGNLMRQVYLEYEDKVEEADLIFRFRLPEEKVILKLDSQKTYRIFENLYTNIIKYAMPHTRVYVNLERIGDEIVIELKNMSSVELNIPAESLTERFVRGDSSRNTEGSGLGLAIARNFAELQKGQMKVDIDGDLFKVTLRWRM
ncbi:MAG: ATP-binding protein [Lachnospiraceae bacterium]|nr:ATP-binding protein [Lachnospiraceae bacterium]